MSISTIQKKEKLLTIHPTRTEKTKSQIVFIHMKKKFYKLFFNRTVLVNMHRFFLVYHCFDFVSSELKWIIDKIFSISLSVVWCIDME